MTERRRLRPPDMQQLVDAAGRWDLVTPEAIAEYRSALEAWRELHRRPQGAVLDDDVAAKDYARRMGQDTGGPEPPTPDPARDADFAVHRDADGRVGTKEIEDALKRLKRNKQERGEV